MVQNAFRWAEQCGRKRRNPVHGEEEIQIILSETFEVKNTQREQTERTGSITMEVGVND